MRCLYSSLPVKSFLYFLVVIVAHCFFLSAEIAFGSDPKVVRVGYYENPPKLFNGIQGKAKGIFPEIIEDIAIKENWHIEWVPGTWKEGLTRLESGEIDIMPDVAYSLKRAEKYEFSDEPVFINWAVLYTRSGLRVESMLDLAGKRVAVMRGSIHTDGQEGIKNQIKKFNLSCEFIEFDSYAEVFLALQNSLAEVGVVNRLFGNTSQKLYDVLPTTVVFNPRHLKFAFPLNGKITPYLKKTIDSHLRNAHSQADSRIQRIIQSYLSGIPIDPIYEGDIDNIYLTPEEKVWIESHPKIRIGIDPEFAPFEFIDKNDQYSGYASDYIRILNQRLGLNMEVVKGPTWKQVMTMAEQGEIDVLASVGFTVERSRFLSYTTPYIGFYRMIFCRSEAPFISGINDLHNLKVAVQAKSSHAGWMKDNTALVPDYYDSLEQTIKAVSEGKADVLIGNLAACTYWIRQFNITNIRVAAPVSLERQLLHMAVRKDWAPLVGILNKGLASISSQEVEEIRNRWTAAGYTVGVSSWVVWQRIGAVVILAMLTVGFFWYWNRRLHQEVKLRTKAEKGLLDSQEKLAERVEERTRELAEANISLQHEMLEKQQIQEKLHRSEKMEALGFMAGGVAHDLNNILAGIVSYPDLLLVNLPEDSSLRQPLEVIKDSGDRAAAVVSDLLTVARGVAIEKQPANLNLLITEYLESPEYQEIKSRYPNVACTTIFESDLKYISCSPVHIKKCLMNLLSNALEAIGDQGTITFVTENRFVEDSKQNIESGMSQWVNLSVSDTGSGISEEDINHIFEPFYSKKVMGRSGTGLGLAVVWNTVQDHGGTIQVRSSDSGTVFELNFPVTEESEFDRPQSLQVSELKGSDEKILVVDDEQQQREIGCTMLTSMGYDVESVDSGEDALVYLKEKQVDLVVLDMIMDPGMNGLTTYEKILQIFPGQKAIIVSGFSENKEVAEAQKLGAGQYIKKPFNYIQLGSAVKKALSNS